MSTSTDASTASFAYQAQTEDGVRLAGTIDAADAEEARARLQGLGLSLIELEPTERRPGRAGRLSGEDFAAFNRQLASLTEAGMPVERGLRLVAQDMRRGRLRRSIRQLAEELEGGASLPEAVEAHRDRFPPLYGQLLEAGLRSGNLAGLLLSLGRHMELKQRLRRAVWRACSYPAMVLVAFAFVLWFIGQAVAPQMRETFEDVGSQGGFLNPEMPMLSEAVFTVAEVMPGLVAWVMGVVVVGGLLWAGLNRLAIGRRWTEPAAFALPLLGPVLKRNLITRWCDTVRLGIEAGMDLPGALSLSGRALGSPAVERDSETLREAHAEGRSLRDLPLSVLTPSVTNALELGTTGPHDLAEMLRSLRDLYADQAEQRLNLLQVVLQPILLLLLAAGVGAAIAAIAWPVLRLIHSVSG